jgi:L-rhamnose mutarotase
MAERIRYAFHMELVPGAGLEYASLHREVDPAVLEEIQRAGIHNYSIFIDGIDLFGFLEVDDLEQCFAVLRRSDAGRPWARRVAALLVEANVDPTRGLPPQLAEVFRFDG